MLSSVSSDHRSDGSTLLEERAVSGKLGTVSGYKILNHNLAGRHYPGSLIKASDQLLATIGSPGLCLGCIDEVLLNRGLDDQRKAAIHCRQFVPVLRKPCFGNRDSGFFGKQVGIAFVPGPANRVPSRSWHTKRFPQEIAIKRNRRYRFISRWVENPAMQVQLATRLQDHFDGLRLVAKAWHADRVGGIARVAGDGVFVIDDTYRHPAATQAAGDSQSLVVSP